ncbi:uncharacterized protein LOC116374391 [Oncorhynchus kisutch]|uniref:uncharacterized protein LOC116371691 n=1 Tax=Oncorhynchus kisutch TaxID=8019 RepID=UPI0012DE7BE7|nr:uncharacterized protein LOC116371691 [Oncorhynchus kisutch]XP_031676443.1 uncharacterized protein LOC116371691 [Oncorhynchus kisutch]XP_031676444.1 uncharacterized protein LOC116371691 [Oncorhynchus kisutch]XP_031676445.1 uncharacterized protein LOC116371691 [Oncorhynchus kisutch]XP_031676447.1 uncharacterized protein LOC116371691 [Oncorhynchus kisutch]XP_031682594.1 uncharacterized protein LOC116374391 [Oncorhynchus kisutch]XP_031682595.1 uncharacterized protein LOC116374391 [Oncorhynchus
MANAAENVVDFFWLKKHFHSLGYTEKVRIKSEGRPLLEIGFMKKKARWIVLMRESKEMPPLCANHCELWAGPNIWGWSINPEPLSQSGRVTRLIERKYDDVISSSSSDDFSIYSFTDCESECDDEDHERRTPPLKIENGNVTKLDVRDMDEDDLSLHFFDESDFLSPGKVSGPVSVKNGLSPLVTSAHRTLAKPYGPCPLL